MYNDTLAAQECKERTPHPNMDAQFPRKVLETYDVHKVTALIACFIKNDTWQCPTLVVLHWAVDGDKKYTGEDLVWADRIIAKDTDLVEMIFRPVTMRTQHCFCFRLCPDLRLPRLTLP